MKKRHFKGNTSYEYAVIGGLVAVACITPLFFLGGTISTGMQDTNAKASVGIDNLTNLLTPVSSSQSNPSGPNFQVSYNPGTGSVVVNTNGMNIVGAPATAGTGTTLATYVYGALITQLSTTPPPGLDVNDPYMRAMRELGQAIQSLAIRSNDVIYGVGSRAGEPPGCRANCESALGPYFGVLNEKYAAFMTLANSSQYSAYSGLSNTVQTTSIFSNQLFGFGILQSLTQNGYNSWANGHGQFGAGHDPNAITGNAGSPPNGWGNPPPPLSALMMNQNGTQVINVGSTPPPPPPAG
ncbi:MAG: hypothetical protein K2X01_01420 [Cyanobacteria bacterium]|nr:hypothetical protein [Cyanobacteriota bacterium]